MRESSSSEPGPHGIADELQRLREEREAERLHFQTAYHLLANAFMNALAMVLVLLGSAFAALLLGLLGYGTVLLNQRVLVPGLLLVMAVTIFFAVRATLRGLGAARYFRRP
jgi:hypothetical protein